MFFKAKTDEEILKTYEVMKILRSHLNTFEIYLETVRRLMTREGYLLAGIEEDGVVRSVAGYRIGESLSWGKYLYIHDLVTDNTERSKGFGKQLLDCLVEEAKKEKCTAVHLDSGVQRHGAHRFYLRERMDIVFHHFKKEL